MDLPRLGLLSVYSTYAYFEDAVPRPQFHSIHISFVIHLCHIVIHDVVYHSIDITQYFGTSGTIWVLCHEHRMWDATCANFWDSGPAAHLAWY